jgi:diadenosine tetraphosphate (Ap4A) HIT family hydrolase/5-methylcytosine-specific restriction endonuclease McrA
MSFEQLSDFISKKMQMQHVYQPIMLIELLKHGGQATEHQIARVLLTLDPTQQKYYENKVRNMVGEVLIKNGVTKREKSVHHLLGFDQLTIDQVEELISLCESKLDTEAAKRGDTYWKHRATDREPVSGSIRYEVLKRANQRCECCGVSINEKPIDVDHIVPRSLGGANSINNYQALCYECNTNKGNRDDTDFRTLKNMFDHREDNCLFCDIQTKDRKRVIAENNLAYSISDGFPVTQGHTLFIPKRHINDYFGLVQAEVNAINALMTEHKGMLQSKDSTIEGFNIGMNCGEVAGQTIFHCHVHLIPRRKGDVENPRGGVRHIIAGKGFYDDKTK